MVALRPDLASYNRAAHFHFLYSDVPGAIAIMKKAIEAGSSSPENIAWCMVDLGNIYFKTGQLALAQQSFTDALRTFKNYHPAYAGLGRVLAETGDIAGAIANYRRAQEITPLPDYAAALFDLYKKSGQDGLAAKQMDLLNVIDKVSIANGEKANRNLVLAFADHDVKLAARARAGAGRTRIPAGRVQLRRARLGALQEPPHRRSPQYMEKALAAQDAGARVPPPR